MNIVLVEPEIPQNTGNIGRLCVGHLCHLHLVKPLGFEITNTRLKRAGLDYWPHLQWTVHEGFEEWLSVVPERSRLHFFTTKTNRSYYDVQFKPGDWLVFGKETKGLGPDILQSYSQQALTIPMWGQIRSFNVANAVSMVIGEAVRQNRSLMDSAPGIS